MNKGVIPESLHFETPNPNVEWDQLPVRVTSEKTDWPSVPGRRPLAGVSAFGLSGANAHVLVEGYGPQAGAAAAGNGVHLPSGGPKPVPVALPGQVGGLSMSADGPVERATRLLPLSGKSTSALRELAERYLSWLRDEEGPAAGPMLSDLAWTAGVGRSHFPRRAGLVFSDAVQLRKGLGALVDTIEPSDETAPHEPARVGFTYTGQDGTGQDGRWSGMGEALYRCEPVARAVLDRCDELFRLDRAASLLDAVLGRAGVEEELNDPGWALPAVYALECALTAQWASVGVRPSVVVGHGPGAVAAARAAGLLSLEEGLRLAVALGALRKTRSKTALEALEAALAGVAAATPSVSLVSDVTGSVVESAAALDLEYWLCQAEDQLDLSGCAKTLAGLEVGVVVENGPSPIAGRRIGDVWPGSAGAPVVLSTLGSPPGNGSSPGPGEGFVRAVAGAYEAGLDISFAGLFAGEVRRRVSLPGYPFQRRRHWI